MHARARARRTRHPWVRVWAPKGVICATFGAHTAVGRGASHPLSEICHHQCASVVTDLEGRASCVDPLGTPGSIAAVERAKRFGLAAVLAFLALNVWTGSPLLALWI